MVQGSPATLDDEAFRDLLNGSPDAILVVDAKGGILFANTQVGQLFGYLGEELLGLEVHHLIPERFRDRHVGHQAGFMAAPARRPMGKNMDLAARRKDGSEFPAEISLSPLETHAAALVQVVIRDVTESHARRAELRAARHAAERASVAKSDFLASMSHEIRTPMNSILGFAQLLVRDRKEPLSDRHRGMVDHIVRGGQHLLRLIDEILDLSRIESGRVSVSLEPVSVKSVLAEVTATLSPLALARQISMVVEAVTDSTPLVVADRTRFAQILLNFGTNAIKYGRPGGRVAFGVSPVREGALRVSVADDGPGIPAEHHANLFEPFHRAGQEGGVVEGTGIGLAIVKRLAALMKCRTGFTSDLGLGSAFWIDLPVHDGPVAPTGTRNLRRAADAGSHDDRRVLYVEDNLANVALMEAFMADRGAVALVSCRTAEEGIDAAVKASIAFDLIILDIHLPGLSGIEAARALRSNPKTSAIPLVALSAAAMPAERLLAEEAGFTLYLTKPLDVDQLSRALDELLGST